MMTETGRVVALDDRWVWVETFQNSACTACSAKAGCGQGLLNSIFSGKRHYVKVSREDQAQDIHMHDVVELGISEHVMLKGSFWIYVLPLIFLVAGAVLTADLTWFQTTDLNALAGAVIGFSMALLILKVHASINAANPAYQPVLTRVISKSSDEVAIVESSI